MTTTVPTTWTIAGFLAVNTIGNITSTSPVERFVFTPATAVAAGLAAVVAHAHLAADCQPDRVLDTGERSAAPVHTRFDVQ